MFKPARRKSKDNGGYTHIGEVKSSLKMGLHRPGANPHTDLRKPIFLLTLPYLATVPFLRRAGANAPDVLAYRYYQTATEFGLTIFLSSVHAPIFTVLGLHPVSTFVFTLRQFSVGLPH